MWVAVSAGVLLRNEHASSSARTVRCQFKVARRSVDVGNRTSQPVDSPLLELFQCDLGGGGHFVKIQAVRILLVLIEGSCKLPLFVINSAPSLRIDAIEFLLDHGGLVGSSEMGAVRCAFKRFTSSRDKLVWERVDANPCPAFITVD